MISNNGNVYAACTVCVTIFIVLAVIRPVSELHALTLAVNSVGFKFYRVTHSKMLSGTNLSLENNLPTFRLNALVTIRAKVIYAEAN